MSSDQTAAEIAPLPRLITLFNPTCCIPLISLLCLDELAPDRQTDRKALSKLPLQRKLAAALIVWLLYLILRLTSALLELTQLHTNGVSLRNGNHKADMLFLVKYYHWTVFSKCWWNHGPQESLLVLNLIVISLAAMEIYSLLSDPHSAITVDHSRAALIFSYAHKYNRFNWALNYPKLDFFYLFIVLKVSHRAHRGLDLWFFTAESIDCVLLKLVGNTRRIAFSTWQWPDLGNGETCQQLSTSRSAKC